jgi:pyruvate,water dikinase
MADARLVIPLSEVGVTDVGLVGGKNASLGELIAQLGGAGIRVPGGFASTETAYRHFVSHNALAPVIAEAIAMLHRDPTTLPIVGSHIRDAFAAATVPPDIERMIRDAYATLCTEAGIENLAVAVRSSATAEDLPDASFAGQHESYLNVSGADDVVRAWLKCVTSMFTDRAISYREGNGFDHTTVALSVGVQRMVRSDTWGAGVMFSIDTESGFRDLVVIDGSWGLGEAVVKGQVDPDRYRVFKPLLANPALTPITSIDRGRKTIKIVYSDGGPEPTVTVATTEMERRALVLTDAEICTLARWAVAIEAHYGRPMDIEWAKDGLSNALFIVQARPETVHTRRAAGLVHYQITNKGAVLLRGLSVGDGAATGPVCRLESAAEIGRFPDGGVLVAEITDPDWVPVMRRAAAIVTDRGGRTSHAAIVSRELGVPAVIGTGTGTTTLVDGSTVTVSCAEGNVGVVYAGAATITRQDIAVSALPTTKTKVMLNLADPGAALAWWQLPTDGIGLARMEFIVTDHIKVHPMALAHPERITDALVAAQIHELTRGYDRPDAYFVDQLASGIAALAAPFWPRPIILRLSDFKTNEYATLLGGTPFEPLEENPMLGWRGASRYYHPGYRDGFALECRAIREVRERRGFTNVIVMVPFCRTPQEADRVLEVMAAEGLVRGENGLEVYVMAEIPSNILLAEDFAARFDGFSIGSNDLTQLTLGIDRDSEILADIGDASNPAVLQLITRLITVAHGCGRKVGFCGQAPSNDPTYARFLVDAGIDSVSVTPDSFVAVKAQIAIAEGRA